MSNPAPILIVTCGNELAGDDGFGSRVARALSREPLDGAEVLDLGTNPSTLIDHLPGRAALIVVDAADGLSLSPGQLIDCDWDAPSRPRLSSEFSLSTHALSIAQQIELARRLDVLPRVVRLLATPMQCAATGAPPTPESLHAADAACRRIRGMVPALAASAAVNSTDPT